MNPDNLRKQHVQTFVYQFEPSQLFFINCVIVKECER